MAERTTHLPVTWAFVVGDGAGIEPALTAWEVGGAADPLPADSLTCGLPSALPAGDRDYPGLLAQSGTYRARRHVSRPQKGPAIIAGVPLDWVTVPMAGQQVSDGVLGPEPVALARRRPPD